MSGFESPGSHVVVRCVVLPQPRWLTSLVRRRCRVRFPGEARRKSVEHRHFALVAQLVQSAPLVKGRSSVRLRPGARTIHDAVGERSTIRLQSGAFGLCRFDSGQRLVNTMRVGLPASHLDSDSRPPRFDSWTRSWAGETQPRRPSWRVNRTGAPGPFAMRFDGATRWESCSPPSAHPGTFGASRLGGETAYAPDPNPGALDGRESSSLSRGTQHHGKASREMAAAPV